MEASQIKVCVRFKQMSTESNQLFDVTYNSDGQSCNVVKNEKEKQFKVQRMLHPDTTQQEIFDEVVMPLMDHFLDGINATIFAYGQTGSGKTFTMLGPEKVVHSIIHNQPFQGEDCGIIPRSVELLFKKFAASNQKYQLSCSYVEVYNEGVYDLLVSKSTEKLTVRDDSREGVVIMGCTEVVITNSKDLMKQIQIGLANCSFAATQANARSSRSHTVLRLKLIQENDLGQTLLSKMSFVDLAGSERISKSQTTGQQLQETKKINQSLTTLGQCILSLSQKNTHHTPYRSSKLTFILKESLGGNTKTCLVCTCSQQQSDEEETISTLRFAQRAQRITLATEIRPNVQKNQRELGQLIKFLQDQVEKLKSQITDQHKQIVELEGKQLKGDESQPASMKHIQVFFSSSTSTDGGDDHQQSQVELLSEVELIPDVIPLEECTWEQLEQQRLDVHKNIKEFQAANHLLSIKVMGITKAIEEKESKMNELYGIIQFNQQKSMDFNRRFKKLTLHLKRVEHEIQSTHEFIQVQDSLNAIQLV